jgi:catechol 2,3-dioxygenase-like lactoylglutathione lyase family enzyme
MYLAPYVYTPERGTNHPMISGAHVMIFSKDAEADREFFRKVLKFPHVDAGDGWLIFALPPAELAVHPSEENGSHELYLLCDDLKSTVKVLKQKKVRCSAPVEHEWGTMVTVKLPGGGKLGLYQPKHALAPR